MIPVNDLQTLARARLRDAEALLQKKRYDGAAYLCGYAVEIALKARICRTLKWPGFPETRSEFQAYQSFKTHDLETLLHLSGIEVKIKARFQPEWAIVSPWDPEDRYKRIGSTSEAETRAMIAAVKVLVRAI